MALEIMKHSENGVSEEGRDTLYMFGGVALMLIGAGVVLQSPAVRRFLGQMAPSGNLLETVLPDMERYLKIRSM